MLGEETPDQTPDQPEPKKKVGRPATGHQPTRAAGRHGEIWDECTARATADGDTMTQFVAAAIRRELNHRRGLDRRAARAAGNA